MKIEERRRHYRDRLVEDSLKLFVSREDEERLFRSCRGGVDVEISYEDNTIQARDVNVSFCPSDDYVRISFAFDAFGDLFRSKRPKASFEIVAEISTKFPGVEARFSGKMPFATGTESSNKALDDLRDCSSLEQVQDLWHGLDNKDQAEIVSDLPHDDSYLPIPISRFILFSHYRFILPHLPCSQYVLEFLVGRPSPTYTNALTTSPPIPPESKKRPAAGLDLLAEIGSSAIRQETVNGVGVQVLVGIGRSKAAKLSKHGVVSVSHLASLDVENNLELARAVTGNRNLTQAARTLSGWRDAARKYLSGRVFSI